MRIAASFALFSILTCVSVARAEPETEVVVAGHRSTRSAREPTLASSRVDARELTRPGATAAEVLSHVPGVQVSESGASTDLATASVRGATSAQTPVYLAGIRLNDDVTGSADLSLIPLWMLGRAEVYRGNAPADADRQGIGGAVFFEPRQPLRNRVLAGVEIGDFHERAAWLGAEQVAKGDGALFAFRASSAHNDYPYLDDSGTSRTDDDERRKRPNADYSQRDGWAIARVALGRPGASLTTVINAFTREQGVTGLAAVPALSARAETSRVLAGLLARVPCGREAGCELLLTSQAVSAHSRLNDPRSELGIPAGRADSQGTRFAQGARVWLRGQRVRGLFGANVEAERLAQGSGYAFASDDALSALRHTTSARIGLSASPTEHTELSALGVVTCDLTRGPQQSRGCADLAPEGRVGARYQWGAFEVRSNIGRYARVPTLGELYGVSALVRGSSALVPEQGLAWDGGGRWEAPLGPVWTYLDVFGFARRVSDLIAYRRSSLGAVQPYNVGSARILGAELEAGAQWGEHARAALALTVLDPRDTTPGRNLSNDLVPYQSRFFGSLFVAGFVDAGLRPLHRAGLDARLSHRGSRLADPAGLLVLPASTALDLGASLDFGQRDAVSVRVAMDDVFDARRFDFIGYPVPQRRWHASVEASW